MSEFDNMVFDHRSTGDGSGITVLLMPVKHVYKLSDTVYVINDIIVCDDDNNFDILFEPDRLRMVSLVTDFERTSHVETDDTGDLVAYRISPIVGEYDQYRVTSFVIMSDAEKVYRDARDIVPHYRGQCS